MGPRSDCQYSSMSDGGCQETSPQGMDGKFPMQSSEIPVPSVTTAAQNAPVNPGRPPHVIAEKTDGNSRNEMLLKIYDTLRRETEDWIKELQNLKVYSLIATASVWSWASLNTDKIGSLHDPQKCFVLFVPLVFSIVFALRSYFIRRMIMFANDHATNIEKDYGLDKTLGWDSFWADRRKNGKDSVWVGEIDGILFVYWLLITVVNAVMGFLFLWSPDGTQSLVG